MKNLAQLVVLLAVAASATACIGFERKSTVAGPSAAGVGTLMGSWVSSNLIPTPSTCADFKWTVTEQTGSTARGTFSATCAGDLKLTGTAKGTINGANIAWSAEGLGNGPGLTDCKIVLEGTAQIGVTSVRIPYSGDTCLGKVSGIETLSRR